MEIVGSGPILLRISARLPFRTRAQRKCFDNWSLSMDTQSDLCPPGNTVPETWRGIPICFLNWPSVQQALIEPGFPILLQAVPWARGAQCLSYRCFLGTILNLLVVFSPWPVLLSVLPPLPTSVHLGPIQWASPEVLKAARWL